jgi:hypothetical protein
METLKAGMGAYHVKVEMYNAQVRVSQAQVQAYNHAMDAVRYQTAAMEKQLMDNMALANPPPIVVPKSVWDRCEIYWTSAKTPKASRMKTLIARLKARLSSRNG